MSLATDKFSKRIRFRYPAPVSGLDTADFEADDMVIRVAEDADSWDLVDGSIASSFRGIKLYFDLTFRYQRKLTSGTKTLDIVEFLALHWIGEQFDQTIEINPFPDSISTFIKIKPVPSEHVFNILNRQRIGRSFTLTVQSERLAGYPSWLKISK